MMAGGHFASDVLWSGGIVWLVALTGFYLFKTDKPVEIPQLSEEKTEKESPHCNNNHRHDITSYNGRAYACNSLYFKEKHEN